MLVAAAARATAGDHGPLAGCHEVVAGAVVLEEDLRSRRDRECQRLAVGTVSERALTVPPSAGFEVGAAPVALEVSQRVIAHQHDVAAVTPVAAVGTTPGHVSLAAETEASITPAAGADEYPRAIEHAPIVEDPTDSDSIP
jgi:hypothetical protein